MKTEITQKTTEFYRSPKKDDNNELYGEFGSECMCCGKPMMKGEVLWIHMNECGDVVHPSISDEDCEKETGSQSQGCFPVGNSCAKKMKGFTFTSTLEKSHPAFTKPH